MDLFDLSLSLSQEMPVYPGDPPFSITRFMTHEKDRLQASALSMSCHAGTHMDAPRHFCPDGRTIDQLPLEWLIGPAFVAALPWRPGQMLDLHDLDLAGRKDGDHLLLATGWDERAGRPLYYRDLPQFAPGSAALLLQWGVRLFGLDLPTVVEQAEPPQPMAMHQRLLGAGIIIVESLANLRQLAGRRIIFQAFPLRLSGCEGSPVRACGWELVQSER